MPLFALRTGVDSLAWLWEPLRQDSGSGRVWLLLGSLMALSFTGAYPRLDSVSSSLKLSAIVVDRAIKGSFFYMEPGIWERNGELACGSSLPQSTPPWQRSKWPSLHCLSISSPGPPSLLALEPKEGPFGCPFSQSQDPAS